MSADITVAEISEMLRRDADGVARALLPRGVYENGRTEWRCRGAESPTGQAISVHVRNDAKQGVVGFWNGHRKGGDLLDLAEAVFGTDTRGAVQWAKRRLGIDDGEGMRMNPAKLEAMRASAEVDRQNREAESAADSAKRREIARQLWADCTRIVPGTAAWSYLRARGLSLRADETELMAHAGLPHPEGGSFPALVARTSAPNGTFAGIWRIFLKHDGSGKAPVETAKLGLGDVRGGAVRLGGVWPVIGVTEGVETAIACRQILSEGSGSLVPVWAALSTSGMTGLVLPDGVSGLRIYADNDPVKLRGAVTLPSPGMTAALAARARVAACGIAVSIITPPVGMDWLDALNAGQRAVAA